MGKLGAFSYPEISLDEARDVVTVIATRLKGRGRKRDVARVLDQQESSGWLSHKLAALRDFGLVEGWGEISLTPLGQQLAFPADEAEAARTRCEAYAQVALFRRLEERLGDPSNPDTTEMAQALQEITGALRSEMMPKVALIRSHLVSMAREKQAPAAVSPREELGEAEQEVAATNTASTAERIEIAVGAARISAPFDESGLDIAIRLLRGLQGQERS